MDTANATSSPSKTRTAAGGAASSPDIALDVSASGAETDATLLERKPKPKRKPGAKWDGRVAGMTLQEYREKKWSVEACYKQSIERRTPAYTMRQSFSEPRNKKNTNFQAGNIYRAYNATLPHSPEWSIPVQLLRSNKDTSPAPNQYKIGSTMDPKRHPTMNKLTGPRFGMEVLLHRDAPAPGPGDYSHEAYVHSSFHKTSPKCCIQGREAWRDHPLAGMGPEVGEYKYETTTRVGKDTSIHWSMQGGGERLAQPRGSSRPVWKQGSNPRGIL